MTDHTEDCCICGGGPVVDGECRDDHHYDDALPIIIEGTSSGLIVR